MRSKKSMLTQVEFDLREATVVLSELVRDVLDFGGAGADGVKYTDAP